MFGEAEGWPARMVKSFCVDPAGRLHASTSNRIFRFNGSRFDGLSSVPTPLSDRTNVTCAFDIHGGVWAGWSEKGAGYFGRMKGGAWETVRIRGRDLSNEVSGIAASRDGRMLVSGASSIFKFDPRTLAVLAEYDCGGLVGPVELFEDTRGYIWSGDFEKGLCVATPDGARLRGRADDGFDASGVFNILEDSDGNVWVGMRALHRLRYRALRYLSAPEGLDMPSVFTALELEPGRILLGGFGLHMLSGGRIGRFETGPGPVSELRPAISSMMRGRDGTVWIGTNYHGLYRLEGGRLVRVIPYQEAGGEILAVFEDSMRRIWIGYRLGIGVLENGAFRMLPGSFRRAGSFAEPSEGTVYAGATEGLLRWSGVNFEPVEESLRTPVLSLQSTLGGMWVGLEGRGLALLASGRRPFLFRPSHGVISSSVTMIFEHGSWTYLGVESEGMVRVRTADLHRVASGDLERTEMQLFNRDDGLGSNFQNRPGFPNWLRASDGKVLIARASGIVVGDLDRLPPQPPAPMVRIESIGIQQPGEDERRIPAQPPLRFDHTVERIEIRAQALSLSSPNKLRFQYRLGGAAAAWVDARGQRYVGFSNLRPGDYRFEIRGSNGLGPWSEPAAVEFSVVAPLWRSWWLAIALGAVAAGGVGMFFYATQSARVRRATTDLRQQEKLAQDRLRSELLVEHTSDLVAFARPTGELVYLNAAGHEMLGYEASLRPPPATLSRLLAAESWNEIHANWSEAERRGTWTAEASLQHSGQNRIPALLVLVFERNAAGETLLVAITARDITERRRLEQDLRQLSAHRASMIEEERKRIAREIHDELGQQLTAIKMGMMLLDAPSVSERVSNLVDQTDVAIRTLRRIASDLRPPVLDHFGLGAAVEWVVSEFSKKVGMRGTWSAPPDLELSPEMSITAFRIVQEALTNVAKHSGASRVDVRLAESNGSLVVSIADNGRGMPKGRPAQGTLGILGMRERATAFGGNLEILENQPGGTIVQALFPLEESGSSGAAS